MIDARDFLDAVAGYSNSGDGGPKPSTDRPVKLGTIDQYYTSGLAHILFDGETTVSQKGYTWVGTYTPVNGERVFLIPVGQSYIIGGSLKSGVDYSRYVAPPLFNGWGNFVDLSFHTPSFTKTVNGVVKVTGMIAGGTVGSGYKLFELPLGFRPEQDTMFPTLTSGNGVGSLIIRSDGTVVPNGPISSTWTSLGNIVFPTEPLVWNDVTLLNGFTEPTSYQSIGLPQYAKDSLGRVWFRGGVGRSTAPTADTPIFNIPAGYRPPYQIHLPVSSWGSGITRSTGLIDVMPNGDVRFKQETQGLAAISFGGVTFSEASVTGWTNATYQNGWSDNSTSGQGPTRYRKDSDGVVHINGLARLGTIPAGIFTLPAGMRPSKTIIRYTQALNLTARIELRADGQVVAQAGSNSWFSLDGITLTAEG